MKTFDDYVFFWSGIYSNWHKMSFEVDGMTFNCAEQYMMYKKAEFFDDQRIMELIMKTSDPKRQKALGREVANFNAAEWDEVCEDIVAHGLYYKFSHNSVLKIALLKTRNKTIVEASPVDTIWGIGMAEDDPDILDESKWRGRNLLGKCLMRVRESIKENAD